MTIEAINISCMRSDNYLFRNLNFSVGAGELIRIDGQNGAGKSTLLKILTGLTSPDKGCVTWDKCSIAQSPHYNEQLAYLGHRDGINLNLTVMENITHQVQLAKAKINNAARQDLLEALSLSGKENKYCYQLSQGQRRKVAICAMFLKNKKIWILDEPFTSLDKSSIDVVKKSIQSHLAANGLVLMVSHHATFEAHRVINL